MNERALLKDMEDDLRRAPKVLYLEGKSDPPISFALLGVHQPGDSIHTSVYVKGLKTDDKGSGNAAVIYRLELAQRNKIPSIFGIIDGDGKPAAELAATFDPPYPGPLFTWKAYSIENLLVQTGWPDGWEIAPDWKAVFQLYSPYVALNRIHVELKAALSTLKLTDYTRPDLAKPLLTVEEVRARLEDDRDLVRGYDVAHCFQAEVDAFNATVQRSLDEAHALINGKWLINHIADDRRWRKSGDCRELWINHAISAGGHPEVRLLWQRITGSPP